MNFSPSSESTLQAGKFTLITGPMFSGKSEHLISIIEQLNKEETCLCFSPSIDRRYGDNKIASHNGLAHEAIMIESCRDIGTHINDNIQHIFIDEIQFLEEESVDTVLKLLSRNINIYAAGLDMDYKSAPFPTIKRLLPLANEHIKKTGLCADCSSPSEHTYKKTKSTALIEVGGEQIYKPLCRACYNNKQSILQ